MASIGLLPDGESGHTFHWTVNTGTHHDALRTTDGNTSYVQTASTGRYLNLTFDNPIKYGIEADDVKPEGIESITSVQIVTEGRAVHRTTNADVDIAFITPSPGLSEFFSYPPHPTSLQKVLGSVRTTTPLGASWTYGNLNDLGIRITKNGTIPVAITWVSLSVEYIPKTDGVFFGTNF